MCSYGCVTPALSTRGTIKLVIIKMPEEGTTCREILFIVASFSGYYHQRNELVVSEHLGNKLFNQIGWLSRTENGAPHRRPERAVSG